MSKHAPPLPNENAYVEPTPALASPPAPASKSLSKPKKNKPMSAQEQDAKINALSNKIANFSNSAAQTAQKSPVGASAASPVNNNHHHHHHNNNNNGNESSSDDDDDLSGSESEEE